MKLLLDRVASPLGPMLVVTDDGALRALEFEDHETRLHRLLRLHYGSTQIMPGPSGGAVGAALANYFDGDLAALDRIAVSTGGTMFQRDVWAALRRLPRAATTTYGAIARGIGRPASCRAVGLANGANPVAIVVPCHLVIGANAQLTGYGGGLDRKAWLIAHEQRHAASYMPGEAVLSA